MPPKTDTPEKIERDVAIPMPEPKAAKVAVVEPQTEEWSSQYSAYTTIFNLEGKDRMVKFTGNKLVLNLSKSLDKAISERMHASSRNHIDFEVIRGNIGADVSKQAATLKKLYEMSEATLARLIGPEELKSCGLAPNCGNKEQLIVAFLKTKTLG